MTNIELSKDTQDALEVLYKICEVIVRKQEILEGLRYFSDGETMESLDETLIETSKVLFAFLVDFENNFGGGFNGIGLSGGSWHLKELSEGNLSKSNLAGLVGGFQAIVNSLILFDANKRTQDALKDIQDVCSEYTDPSKKRKAA